MKARPLIPLWTAVEVEQITESAIRHAISWADAAEQFALVRENGMRVLEEWDEVFSRLEDVDGPLALLNYVHPNANVREAADHALVRFADTQTNLLHRRKLYELVKTAEPSSRAGAGLKEVVLNRFVDAGIALSASAQQRVGEITREIIELGQDFERNLREEVRTFRIPAEFVGDLPHSYVASQRRETNADLVVGFNSADYQTVLRHLSSADLRHKYYVSAMSRAFPANIQILDRLAGLRKELALLHGYPSYAHYALRRRMLRDPARVRDFLEQTLAQLREGERTDVNALRALKEHLGSISPSDRGLSWADVPFYEGKLGGVTGEESQPFSVPEALGWMLSVAERLYGIRFQAVEVPTWHDEVTYRDVHDDSGAFLGGIYFDLFPREGKQKNAGVETIRRASKRLQRTPIAALVANFSRVGPMSDDDLKVLFHEFGHVLHEVFSETIYHAHAGTNVPLDFVEAPSQVFEQWRNHPQSLALFDAKHRIVHARAGTASGSREKIGTALSSVRQCLYGLLDLALASEEPPATMDHWKKLESSTLLGHIEGTAFPAIFEHIATEYACGYYGYVWSKELASRMFGEFEPNIMDPEKGWRFRRLLARGGELQPDELLSNFFTFPNRSASGNSFEELL